MTIRITNPLLEVDGYGITSSATTSLSFEDNLLIKEDGYGYTIDYKKPDILTVGKERSEFSSIKAAVDSVTTTPVVIEVAPGTYIEDPFTIPTNVAVIADGDESTTTILPSDPNSDLITMESTSRLRGFSIKNVTGAAGIKITNAPAGPAIIAQIVIRNCDEHLVLEGDTSPVFAITSFTSNISGPSTRAFIRVESIGGTATELSTYSANTFVELDGTSFIHGIEVLGTGAIADCNVDMRSSTGVGQAIYLENGAKMDSHNGAQIASFDIGIHAANVGVGPRITTSFIEIEDSASYDIKLDHPATRGSLLASLDIDKVLVDDSAPIKLLFTSLDETKDTGIFTKGAIFQADTFDRSANLSKLVREETSLGAIEGGIITHNSGLDFDVSDGYGFLLDPTELFVKEIEWSADTLTLPADSESYIYVDTNGVVQSALTPQSLTTTIPLGRVATESSTVRFIELVEMDINHIGNKVEQYLRNIGPVFGKGGIVSESGIRNLDVTAGSYNYGINSLDLAGGTAIEWTEIYQDGYGDWIENTGQNTISNSQYDDGSGTLANIPTGEYAAHTLYAIGDSGNEKYFLVFSQDTYLTQFEAGAAPLPLTPSYISDAVVRLASLIVQEGESNIIEVVDIRPRIGFAAPSTAGTTNHGNLLGLLGDDHPQYLLVSGTRSMTGNLDMGSQNITNVNLVDGVDVSDHSNRHLPNGADPITTAAPSTSLDANTTNSTGTANSLARSDHSHDITTASAVSITGTNAEGTSSELARANHTHQGVHSVDVNGGIDRFGDLTIQEGYGIDIEDDGYGVFTISSSASSFGATITYDFVVDGSTNGKWFSPVDKDIVVPEAGLAVPFDIEAIGLTYTNRLSDRGIDIEFYKNGTTASELIFTWQIRNKATAFKTNGLSSLTFAAGDRIRLFGRTVSGQLTPDDTVIEVLVRVTNSSTGEGGTQFTD